MPKRVVWRDGLPVKRIYTLPADILVVDIARWIAGRRASWQRGVHDTNVGDARIKSKAAAAAGVAKPSCSPTLVYDWNWSTRPTRNNDGITSGTYDKAIPRRW